MMCLHMEAVMRLVSLLGIWVVATSGCGGGGDDGGGTGGGGADAGGTAGSGAPDAAKATHMFTLGATEVRLRKRFGFSAPAVDHVFLDVRLALENIGEAQPLSVSPLRFSLQTTDALIYSSNGLGSSLPKACPDNVSLAIGGQLECHVGFEIFASEMASILLYLDPAEPVARGASAPIASVLPALVACSYWQSPAPPDCMSCVDTARNFPSGICSSAFNSAINACQCVTGDTCTQLMSGCTPSAACTAALDDYQGCIYDRCLSSCPLAE